MKMTKQSRMKSWIGIFLLAVLISVNLMLLTGVIDSGRIASTLARYTAQDGEIEHPLLILLIIQAEMLLAGAAAFYFLKHGKGKSLTLLTGLGLLITLLMLILAFVFYRSYDSEFLWWMYAEDYFFENLTALLHIGCAILFLILAIRSRKWGISPPLSVLLFAFFFFVGMEEISWGQRLLHLETPPFMKAVNTLGETNIHNILPVENREPVYVGFFVLVSLIFMSTGLARKIGGASSWIGKFVPFLPPPDFFYFGLLIIGILILPRYLVFWEVIEQIFAVICATYAIHTFRRLSRPKREGSPAPSIKK